ncbi:MAG: hypothetical protein KGS61_16250, partial [Verrucomicrobia bacterium]|nr:hypothetical protein [Verrucomicrobiota bacterium]
FGWTNRPLNRYLGTPGVFHCPSDKGDSHPAVVGVKNCYVAYGTSYLVQWEYDSYRVQHATCTPFPGDPPVKRTGFTNTANKIIQGDWPWHGDRPISDPRTRWHLRSGRRTFNMLFADSHCSFYTFPLSVESMGYSPPWGSDPPPDAGFGWW